MTTALERAPHRAIGRFHAVLLAGSLSLFLGTLLADHAYWTSHQVEWSNFASWLLVGAEVFAGGALLFAVIEGVRHGWQGSRLGYTLVLAAAWGAGFIDALVHARDAWAVMPAGLYLSFVAALLALVATWLGFSTLRAGGAA